MKVNEIYSSIQGEGPNTGKLTTFVRFGGCNLRCPGWGYGERFDGSQIAGCDTVHAVDSSWRSTWIKTSPTKIVEQIPENIELVCLTGGEPLIQPADELSELGVRLEECGHIIEIFTNGTQLIPEWLRLMKSYIIMDFKLSGSGEYGKFMNMNLGLLRPQDTIKFVCKDRDDIDQAEKFIKVFRDLTKAKFSFGAVWDSEITEAEIADIIKSKVPEASLNIQLHKYLWSPNERRR